jgi:hypothetical protein
MASNAARTRVPMSLNPNRWEIWIPGRHRPGDHGDTVEVTTVSPEYFRTMGVAIVEGRAFTDADRPDTPRVAIVNETLARRVWPGQSAIGQIFRTRGGEGPPFQIVGVSADHKVLTRSEPPTPFLQMPRNQRPNPIPPLSRARARRGTLLRDMWRELLHARPNIVPVENQTMEMGWMPRCFRKSSADRARRPVATPLAAVVRVIAPDGAAHERGWDPHGPRRAPRRGRRDGDAAGAVRCRRRAPGGLPTGGSPGGLRDPLRR